jgi:predicted esterase
MFRVSDARNARAMAAVCTVVGLAAMIVAPWGRTAGATGPAVASAGAGASVGASVVAEAPAARARTPEAPAWVDAEAAAGKSFVYPPQGEIASPRPVTVMLHGMCGHPQSACGPFVDVSTARGWLVCPKGEDPCGGGTRWRIGGHDDAQLVDASVQALARGHAGEVDTASPRVIAGFSLGGTAAVRIAEASSNTYKGLVVIASQVHPDADALKKAGIQRVVLAAGDMDMTNAPLQEDARKMDARGLPTRFVSLGHFGHGYPADMEDRMREPMKWVAGGT